MTYGEGIIERLPIHNKLNNPKNPMRILLIKTVGALLDNYDDNLINVFNGIFLSESEGEYLNLIGLDYNIPRRINENDEDYRSRIVYESIGHLTCNFLEDVYDIHLFTKSPNFIPNDNVMVSDNHYISDNGFMAVTNEETKKILNNKFVIGEDIKWLTL